MEHIARHEQPHSPPGHLEQLRMRGEKLPEGPARLQYEDFLRRVDVLLADLGFESIEAFVKGAKETEKNLEALPHLQALLRKLMEIYRTKEVVKDDQEYRFPLEGRGPIVQTELVQGQVFVVFEEEGKQVVCNKNGETILSTPHIVTFINKETIPFIEVLFRASDEDPNVNDFEDRLVRRLYDLAGNELMSGEEFVYPPTKGKITCIDIKKKLLYDRSGKTLFQDERYSVTNTCHEIAGEMYHVIYDQENEECFFINGDAERVGPNCLTFGLDLPEHASGEGDYIAALGCRDGWKLLRADGGTESLPLQYQAFYLAKGVKLFEQTDDNDLPVMTNEQGEVVFDDSMSPEGYRLEEIEDGYACGDTIYFIAIFIDPETNFRIEHLIDQQGKIVEVEGVQEQAFQMVQYAGISKDRIFFEAIKMPGVGYLIDQRGKVCARGNYVRLLHDQNGEPYFSDKNKDRKWVVRNEDGDDVGIREGVNEPVKMVIHPHGTLTIWRRGQIQSVTRGSSQRMIMQGRDLQVLYDQNGMPYFLKEEPGANALICAERPLNNLFQGIYLGNIVPMQDRLLFLEKNITTNIVDTQGGVFAEEEGGILCFERFDERHLRIVSVQEGELVSKVIEVEF